MVAIGDSAAKPQRSRLTVVACIAVAAVALHAWGWSYIGYDVGRWLMPWYDHIRTRGPLDAFAQPFSNYTPPYLYLMAAASLFDGLVQPLSVIKLLSVAGTGALATSVYHLLGALNVERRGEKAALVFLLPTTLLNAPVLAQCDAMWSAASIMAVAAAVGRRPAALLIWCGIAVAFKLQAIFLAPFVIAWLLAERVRPALWLIPAAIYAAAMAPAWLLGWPATDLATIYLRQAQYFNTIGNASNPWIFAAAVGPAAFDVFWVGYLAGFTAVAAYVWRFARPPLAGPDLLLAALLSSMLLPFLLPKMHERYFFLADILALAYAWAVRKREALHLALAVQSASTLALLGYFEKIRFYPMIGCILLLMAFAVILRELNQSPVSSASPGAGRLQRT